MEIKFNANANSPKLVVSNSFDFIITYLGDNYTTYLKKYLEDKKNTLIPIIKGQELVFVALLIEEPKTTYRNLELARRLASQALKAIKKEKVTSISIFSDLNKELQLSFLEGFLLADYSFDKYKTKKSESNLKSLFLDVSLEEELKSINALVEANNIARTLVNEPVSYLNAEKLSEEIITLGKQNGFKTEVLNKKQIESLKMGGLLAVNKGSEVPPTFNVLEWKPSNFKNSKPIIFVGKGVVYDTGGYDLKTGGHMEHMKMDMGGAAAVVGALCAISKNQLPVHVIGLIPSTDNRIGPNGLVTDDVITMYDGTTVEVKNTDAEGRLILADALAYAKKYEPELVIDLATLTGAAWRVTSHYGSAMMGNASESIKKDLQLAGEQAHERLIEFPYWEEFDEEIKSDVADIKNLGNPCGGATTAGKFLEHFTDYPWVHLDIAGPAFVQKPYHYFDTGATGVGVRLLFQYLKNLVN